MDMMLILIQKNIIPLLEVKPVQKEQIIHPT